MWRVTSEEHTGVTNTTRPREGPVNMIHSATNYDLAVQHGNELADAAERRRQTHRFQQWMSSRRRPSNSTLGGR